MGTTRHFHVVFDVRVLVLNLSNSDTQSNTEHPQPRQRTLIETKSQRSHRSRKSNSSRRLSVHSSGKSQTSSTSLLSYDKKEMFVKVARLETELLYHDVEVKVQQNSR
jgi:hypothetical protein